MSEESAKWYKRRTDRLLQNITRLDTLIDLNKADPSQKVTKKDLAALQTWVKVCLESIREVYEIDQILDRNLFWNSKFHAELTGRIDKEHAKRIEATDDVTKSLKAIRKWMREYQPTLDRAREYQEQLRGEPNRG